MGRVILTGGARATKPLSGVPASEFAVGSSVYLMENGVATEYLVVNQGVPSGSSLYDLSCNGTWLLRKNIKENRQWHSSNSNSYKASTIHSYLNSTFFNLFGSVEQSTVKQVKIPYVYGTGSGGYVASGSNGLSAQIFLLSCYEVGLTQSVDSYFPIDGAKLNYFINGNDSIAQANRIANLNGSVSDWWLRSPSTGSTSSVYEVYGGGNYGGDSCSNSHGIRPALIIPSKSVFDETTLILKGVP